MTAQHPRFGDFQHQTVVSTFTPRLSDMVPTERRFGLPHQVQYLYGGFRDGDGTNFVVERKFVGPMTGGCYIMSDESGRLALHPYSLYTARGEARRSVEPGRWQWSNHLMQAIRERVGASGEDLSLNMTLTDDAIEYAEGDVIEVAGRCLGPGLQFYMPMRDYPLFYSTHAFWVEGSCFGRPVEGFIGIDTGYWAQGREWKEYDIFKDVEVAWQVFCNAYGETVEWGVLVKGRQGMAAAAIFEDGEVVALADAFELRVDLDDEDDIVTASYDIAGTQAIFRTDPGGKMSDFMEARWGGYRAVAGQTRRVGDARDPDFWFCWLEYFSERVREEGLTKS